MGTRAIRATAAGGATSRLRVASQVVLCWLAAALLVPVPSANAEEPSAPASSPEAALEAPPPDEFFIAYWDRGVRYRVMSPSIGDEKVQSVLPFLKRRELVRGRLGLKLAVDGAVYEGSGHLRDVDDALKVRRSFFYLDGNFFLVFPATFKIDFGFITRKVYLDKAQLYFDRIPYVGRLTLGQFDAPISLEALESSRDLTFMEQGSPVQAFGLGSRAGIQLSNGFLAERATWALGWFADGSGTELGDKSSSLARLVGRLTWLPRDETESLLHLGLGVSLLGKAQDGIRYQSRPESYLAGIVVDTGEIDADRSVVIGLEQAAVRGPLSVQGEYFHAFVPQGDHQFFGGYLYFSDFLTGESRPYNHCSGVFGQVLPKSDFSIRKRHFGAWEWGARLSYLDLTDGNVKGGRMFMLTTGCNWYWNRYIRWQFNYGFANVDGGPSSGKLHILQMRFQLYM